MLHSRQNKCEITETHKIRRVMLACAVKERIKIWTSPCTVDCCCCSFRSAIRLAFGLCVMSLFRAGGCISLLTGTYSCMWRNIYDASVDIPLHFFHFILVHLLSARISFSQPLILSSNLPLRSPSYSLHHHRFLSYWNHFISLLFCYTFCVSRFRWHLLEMLFFSCVFASSTYILAALWWFVFIRTFSAVINNIHARAHAQAHTHAFTFFFNVSDSHVVCFRWLLIFACWTNVFTCIAFFVALPPLCTSLSQSNLTPSLSIYSAALQLLTVFHLHFQQKS